MAKFVVLLRGVNVGKAKRVPMSDFQKLLLEVGCTQATTILNSGNAVVVAARTTPSAIESKISKAIEKRFAFEVPVIVKSSEEFLSIVESNDFTREAEDSSRLVVIFARNRERLQSLSPLKDLISSLERFSIKEKAAYLYCPEGVLKSKAAEALLGKAGKEVTTRNWATVLKIHRLISEDPIQKKVRLP